MGATMLAHGLRRAAAVLAAAVLALPAAADHFALIGDTPYSDYERRELPRLLAAVGDTLPAFVIHAGDIKGGSSPCSNALFADRRTLFNDSPAPFILVPGDNEWSDCDRVSAGAYAQGERLRYLRTVFYPDAQSLGRRRIALERQPGWPEHQRWRHGGVLFATLNVPGGNNNFRRDGQPGAEAAGRMPRVLDWLAEAFALARAERLPGLVIVMQANPGFRHFAQGLPHAGYRTLIEALRRETLDFPGQVLLVHGDTHWQRVDQPLRHPETHAPLANFTRVETYGYPQLGWVEVRIDPAAARLFAITAHPWPPARSP